MAIRLTLMCLAMCTLLEHCPTASAQDFYRKTVRKDPVTGRQRIVSVDTPRVTAGRRGGFVFNPNTGSWQVTALGRNRFTGRLEYYNQYMDPQTGARYMTATRFNPFSGRYQTVHQFTPPPPEKRTPEESAAQAVVEEHQPPAEGKGIRVIEVKTPADAPPAAVPPADGSQTPPTQTNDLVPPRPSIRVIPPLGGPPSTPSAFGQELMAPPGAGSIPPCGSEI